MAINASLNYIAVGGNRHPSAADWDTSSGLICFGSGRNLAIWAPEESHEAETAKRTGIISIVNAHQDTVNAVRFAAPGQDGLPIILSGSADQVIRVWQATSKEPDDLRCTASLHEHKGSVNCISVLHESGLVASGAADGTMKIWQLSRAPSAATLDLLQSIDLRGKYFPLAVSLHPLGSPGGFVLAVGGTRSSIDIYASNGAKDHPSFDWQTTLTGHDGWIRSLDFVQAQPGSDLLLASASQDKYIRVWRIRHEETSGNDYGSSSEMTASPLLSNKTHRLTSDTGTLSITFDALLLGHEDWIYSVRWNRHSDTLQLLSASADNSLVIWEPEAASGIWICRDRLGEVSAQKGSTTATGSAGGFWIGLWSRTGRSIVSLGRTGSWRRWVRDDTTGSWEQQAAISGHTRDVRDVAWSRTGSYLLSTSADQTTRAHALHRNIRENWFELARPQIHGYDLNCVETIGDWQFISGADEKLLRVFDAPAPFAASLRALSDVQVADVHDMPETASVPVLGLSNKASDGTEMEASAREHDLNDKAAEPVHDSQVAADSHWHQPFEDTLSRHALWPEREKLYGHGFEVSSLAVSHDATVIATSCKASSTEHAVIRLYDTQNWQALKPPLTAHALTVTCLTFSEDDQMLLSGGRDRQWSVFERASPRSLSYALQSSNPKGHSRMILGAAWAPNFPGSVFGTAGRDKCVKLWSREESGFACRSTISATSAVTSIDFCMLGDRMTLLLACGLESGAVIVHALEPSTLNIMNTHELGESISPSLSVNRVKWQPKRPDEDESEKTPSFHKRLAIASQDSSVRIVKVQVA